VQEAFCRARNSPRKPPSAGRAAGKNLEAGITAARLCLLISMANISNGKAPIPVSYRTQRPLNYTLITGGEPSCRKGRGCVREREGRPASCRPVRHRPQRREGTARRSLVQGFYQAIWRS